MFRSPLIALIFTISLTATARAQEDDAPSEADLMYKAADPRVQLK